MKEAEKAIEDMEAFMTKGFYDLSLRKDRRRARSYLCVLIGESINPLATWCEAKSRGRKYLHTGK